MNKTTKKEKKRNALKKDLKEALKESVSLRKDRKQSDEVAQIERKVASYARNQVSNGPLKALSTEIEKQAFTVTCPALLRESNERPAKYADPLNMLPTVSSLPFKVEDVSFGGSSDQVLTGSQSFIVQTRDPMRSYIKFEANEANTPYNYNAMFFQNGSTSDTFVQPLLPNVPYELPIAYYQSDGLSGFNPHDEILPCGSVKHAPNTPYVWLDKGAVITGTTFVDAPGDATNLIASIYYTDGYFDTEVGELDLTTGTTDPVTDTFTVIKSGHYGIRLLSTTGNGSAQSEHLNISISSPATGNMSVSGHHILPGLIDMIDTVQGVRIIGSTTLFSNTTAELVKGGSNVMIQSNTDEEWYSDYVSQGYTGISGKNGMVDLPAATGIYAWLKPLNVKDFEVVKTWVSKPSGIEKLRYSVISASSFIVIFIDADAPGGGQSITGKFHIDFSVEFTTNNVLLERDAGHEDQMLQMRVFKELNHMPQAFENPTHIKEIFNKVKSWIPGIVSVLKPLIPIITGLL